jgi:hypothetical protein
VRVDGIYDLASWLLVSANSQGNWTAEALPTQHAAATRRKSSFPRLYRLPGSTLTHGRVLMALFISLRMFTTWIMRGQNESAKACGGSAKGLENEFVCSALAACF